MADRCELFSSRHLRVGVDPMFSWSKGSPDAVRAAFTPLCVLTVDDVVDRANSGWGPTVSERFCYAP